MTAVVREQPTPAVALQVVLMLAIIFWMYGGYAWLTNAVSADRVSRPLVLLAGMAGFFLVALTVPDAFDGGGLAFGLAYGVVIAVHIGLLSGATRIRSFRGVVRVGQFNAAIAVAVGTSGAIGGETQACLWWNYLGGDDGLAEESLMAASPARRSILAIRAYGYAHLALLLGILSIAAAVEEVAHHPSALLSIGLAVALGGGGALYLSGQAAFRASLDIGSPGPQLVAALPCLATVPLGAAVIAVAQLGALLAVFLLLFAFASYRTPSRGVAVHR